MAIRSLIYNSEWYPGLRVRVTHSSGLAVFSFAFLVLRAASVLGAQVQTDSLSIDFQSPPDAAKPRVWWHWMNGNVTKEGIRRDLEWMKRVGVGGADAIDASIDTPQVVKDRLVYMSPAWKKAFRYAATQSDQLGLELSIDTSPGWNETGGTWVKPQQAMKKLVWSSTVIEGGPPFKGVLASPPGVSGPFQDVALVPRSANSEIGKTLQFYADAAVIAYRLPTEEATPRPVTVSTSDGPIDGNLLADGDLRKSLTLVAHEGTAWVQLAYDRPITIRSAVLGTPLPADAAIGAVSSPVIIGKLQAQDANGNFDLVAELGITTCPQVTVSFKPITAQVFRVTFSQGPRWQPSSPPSPGLDPLYVVESKPPPSFAISELALREQGGINEYERKAEFATANDYYSLTTPEEAADHPVRPADVVDLSAKMASDGALDWTPPAGQWVVLRLGYSLTGVTNYPATREATGLEVDKLNRRYVSEYMQHYLETYSSFLPPSLIGAHGLRGLMADSTEVGPQNWSDDMLEQFQRLRGYDARPWLPALTGVIIESAAASDQFLWDFRRTIAQLTAESHYGGIAQSAHEHGLLFYGEALENQRPVLGDDLEMRRYADVPTGAMWTFPRGGHPSATYVADDRGAASVSHLYGQNLAAAESFTNCSPAPWAFSPRDLKPVADLEFALGINRIIVHSSVHQPIEKPPGLSLWVCAQFFNRHETWAEQAGAWMTYLARSSYLLQQGRFVADVAYFYGEEAPLTILQEQGRLYDTPKDHPFDFVNSDALLNLIQVHDGALTTPSGMRYQVLQLGGTSQRMTLPVLRKLRDFVQQGAIVVGAPPIDSPSLKDDTGDFQRLRAELWGSDGAGAKLGRGQVYGANTVDAALGSRGVAPDVSYTRPHEDTELLSLHRTLANGEIYFLTNRKDREEELEVSFRVSGKSPELWHAETGQTESVSYRIEGGRTIVPLKLRPCDALFVVFRKPARSPSRDIAEPLVQQLAELQGPWTVTFQLGRGAPAKLSLDRLASWTANADSGVKYFSGTATYARTLEAPQAWFQSDSRLRLDLGEVRDLAEVFLNGSSLGTVWNPPYALEVTSAMHPGKNALEVRVTNLWVNRLIGDQQPGATRYTFTTLPTYTRTAPLLDSGLLGPVTISRLSAPSH